MISSYHSVEPRFTWDIIEQTAHASSPSSDIAQQISTRVTLLKQLADSESDAGAKLLQLLYLWSTRQLSTYVVP